MSNKTIHFAELQLLLVAIVWGGGFVATDYCLYAHMPTLLILTLRFSIAAISMALCSIKEFKNLDKRTLFHGTMAGLLLFFAFYLQIIGQKSTTISTSAFLTATNVIMVPFVVWIISKNRPKLKFFFLAFVTFIGITILTFDPSQGISVNIGALLILLCAVLYAIHIAYLGIVSKGLNVKLLTLLQLATCGIISTILFFISDFSSTPSSAYINGILPALYLGLFSTCFCYFFQTKAQQIVPPSKVGIILCTEGLFGTIFSVVLGLEAFKMNILVGGILIILSVMLSEIDFKSKKKQ